MLRGRASHRARSAGRPTSHLAGAVPRPSETRGRLRSIRVQLSEVENGSCGRLREQKGRGANWAILELSRKPLREGITHSQRSALTNLRPKGTGAQHRAHRGRLPLPASLSQRPALCTPHQPASWLLFLAGGPAPRTRQVAPRQASTHNWRCTNNNESAFILHVTITKLSRDVKMAYLCVK